MQNQSSSVVFVIKNISIAERSHDALLNVLAKHFNVQIQTSEFKRATQDLTAYVFGYDSWRHLQKSLSDDVSLPDEKCTTTKFNKRREYQTKRLKDGVKLFLSDIEKMDVLALKSSEVIDLWQPTAAARYAQAILSVQRNSYRMKPNFIPNVVKNAFDQLESNRHEKISRIKIQYIIDSIVIYSSEEGINANQNTQSDFQRWLLEGGGIIATRLLNQLDNIEQQQLGCELLEFVAHQGGNPYSYLQLVRVYSESWFLPNQITSQDEKRFTKAKQAITKAEQLWKTDLKPMASTLLELYVVKARTLLCLPIGKNPKPKYPEMAQLFADWSMYGVLGMFYLAILHDDLSLDFEGIQFTPELKKYFEHDKDAYQPKLAHQYYQQFLQIEKRAIDKELCVLKEMRLFPQDLTNLHFIEIASVASQRLKSSLEGDQQ